MVGRVRNLRCRASKTELQTILAKVRDLEAKEEQNLARVSFSSLEQKRAVEDHIW